ncbi:MAG: YeeE/YedE family protein [Flammeovirgaceae bacterium]|nr:YeeE/YedE family protein [Flammeovirgaceae bacterium]MBE62749.1 YeeE/YedE family protein [Flammeovirgaceae bacterium]HCX22598.1 YeeE/YedE family protein [Cytophagales bacterium]
MEVLKAPWPWYVAGPLITVVMVLMLFFGKSFGISSTLRTICSIGGAGKFSDFFKIEWRSAVWNLFFVAGCIIGGFIAANYLSPDQPISLNVKTIESLQAFGIADPGSDYLPTSIFNWENLLSTQGIVFMVLGGILVGFGTRYADGCTSGHAISGLSNLQLPSLIAVVGFFIGGLIMTHLILPLIL